MAGDLIFNELSLLAPLPNEHVARDKMEQFVGCILLAREIGAGRILRTDEHFYGSELAPGYFLGSWLNDNLVDVEKRRLLRGAATGGPFLRGLPDLQDKIKDFSFSFRGEKAVGLGVAYLGDSMSLSVESSSVWADDVLILDTEAFDEEGEIVMDTVTVRNASTSSNVAVHKPWFKQKQINTVADGEQLWAQRESLFPMLMFCPGVQEQLLDLQVHGTLVRVMRRLNELNSVCDRWAEGAFAFDQLTDSSTESGPTLRHGKYGQLRVFDGLDGKSKQFTWHMKIFADNMRIYFEPDVSSRKVVVAYVGPHLRTVTFK